MSSKKLLTIFFVAIILNTYAQFPPPAGMEGSTAIHKDSSTLVNWGTACIVERGAINISDLNLGYVTFGSHELAAGIADNQIVSLGDGGKATLTFEKPITNDTGSDFAVFENGFSDVYLELAFVEVSSNGTDFFRFNAVSLTDTLTQIEAFGALDATKLHNFAGKYRVDYGTPFDLDELPDDPTLDKTQITHVRLVDVVGSMNIAYATRDSQGNKVNDPWPTAFETGGFDLDAVGVINESNNSGLFEFTAQLNSKVYPNPFSDIIKISSSEQYDQLIVNDVTGREIWVSSEKGLKFEIDTYSWKSGVYIVMIRFKKHAKYHKLVKP